MTIALVANSDYCTRASCGEVSIEKLVKAIFPNVLERNVFFHNVKLLNKCHGYTVYWYGSGSNGKTTLIHALMHEYGYKQQVATAHDEEEVYTHNGNTIKITNIKPDNTVSEIVTYFGRTFS